jgi:fimbrial chaperone protein
MKTILTLDKLSLVVCNILLCAAMNTPVDAASLSVTPIIIENIGGQNAHVVTLHNAGEKSISAQVRILAWRQSNGDDILEETRQVVASPPIAEVGPGGDFTIRVVRVSNEPLVSEESYRLLIDEIPDAALRRNGLVALAIRFSVPAFYSPADASLPRVTWSVVRSGSRSQLVASNMGEKRLKVSDLYYGGKPVAKGLAGYILGRSEKTWPLPPGAKGTGSVTAITDRGPLAGTANAK